MAFLSRDGAAHQDVRASDVAGRAEDGSIRPWKDREEIARIISAWARARLRGNGGGGGGDGSQLQPCNLDGDLEDGRVLLHLVQVRTL